MSSKITFKQANERFLEQNRNDIELCEDGYKGWKSKSKFYDLIEKDWFWCIPYDVFENKVVHPNRKQEKTKKFNLLKYGSEYAHQTDNIKEKIRQTLISNHNITNINNIRSKRFITETGQYIKEWWEQLPDPKPAWITLTQYFDNEQIPLDKLESYINNYKSSKSSLELLGKDLFGIDHFNKYVDKELKYRPDFKLSDTIYVNVDGLYWHSEHKKSNRYHFNLRLDFENKNLRIFQFNEFEIKERSNIVKSIIENAIGKTHNKIYARNCIIKNVLQQDAKEFLISNHLMGEIKAKHIGLYFNDKLVTLLSYKEKKDVCKIERFCSVSNTNVIGGFSKLLKYLELNLIKQSTKEIHNWVDLRYGLGKHLENKDFKLIRDTLGWKWTDGSNTFNRLKCKANMDERKLTESEHAKELGWFKIYDAGQRLYVKKLK